MSEIVSMDEAKKAATKNLAEAVGMRFTTPTGAEGTVIAEPSSRGKVQAELTCTEANCTETHVREISDWHQCGKCRTHKKSKSRGGGGGSVSVDGNVMREMKILDTDSEEVRQQKEEVNALVRQLKEKEAAEKKVKAEQAAAERKAKQEQERQEREAKRAAEQAAALKARLAAIKAEAEKRGVPVSSKTLEEIEGEEQVG